MPGALAWAFQETDRLFHEQCAREPLDHSGSTALVAVVAGPTVYVANAGDSRAVVGRRGRAIPLSRDHRGLNHDERARIESLGGYICSDGFLMGELGVTRALGDWHLEGLKAAGAASADLRLSNVPEVDVYSVHDDDDFLILACDGFWDVVSNER